MTTKYLTGVYNYSYNLSSAYSAVSITSTGTLHGSDGQPVQPRFHNIGPGNGLDMKYPASAYNFGFIGGGTGGDGMGAYTYTHNYPASAGGSGGAGVYATAGVHVANYALIQGGQGGQGGYGVASISEFNGGAGGDGGSGVLIIGAGSLYNSVNHHIQGGLGGAGGYGQQGGVGGTGGSGGYGIDIASGAHASNYGFLNGGTGGPGGGGKASGGTGGRGGIGALVENGTLINRGYIFGGTGGPGGAGGGAAGVSGAGARVVGGLIENDAGATISGQVGVYVQGGTVTNFGVIEGTGGTSIYVNSGAGGRVIAEPGAQFIGEVQGGGGALELAGGTGTITGLGGSGTLYGAEAMTFSGFGSYAIDAGGIWTLVSGDTVASGKSLTNSGTLVASGAVINAGTISLVSTAAAVADLRIAAAGATLSGGGTVTLAGPKSRILGAALTATLTNVDNTISGQGWLGLNQMTMINRAKGVIDAVGSQGLVVSTKSETLINSGLMASASGSTLILLSTTIDQSGGGTILANGRAYLEACKVVGGTFGSAGTGLAIVNVNGSVLDGHAKAVTLTGVTDVLNGVSLTLDGTLQGAGHINTFGLTQASKLLVGPDGLSLAGGQINLAQSADNTITSASGVATLTNVSDHIAGAGNIGAGAMILVNKTAGVIAGNGAVTLTIDTGTHTITNAGAIDSVGAGQVLVRSAVNNTGLLYAAAGTLTLDGAVIGTGTGQIKTGVLNIAASFGEMVTFVSGATGVLRLTDFTGFTGQVKGLSSTGANSIDLGGFSPTGAKASYSGTAASGVLTIANATQTAHIHVLGNYLGATWKLSSDGAKGTTVKDPLAAAAASPSQLAQAMAVLGANSGGALVAGLPEHRLFHPMLAARGHAAVA